MGAALEHRDLYLLLPLDFWRLEAFRVALWQRDEKIQQKEKCGTSTLKSWQKLCKKISGVSTGPQKVLRNRGRTKTNGLSRQPGQMSWHPTTERTRDRDHAGLPLSQEVLIDRAGQVCLNKKPRMETITSAEVEEQLDQSDRRKTRTASHDWRRVKRVRRQLPPLSRHPSPQAWIVYATDKGRRYLTSTPPTSMPISISVFFSSSLSLFPISNSNPLFGPLEQWVRRRVLNWIQNWSFKLDWTELCSSKTIRMLWYLRCH